MKPHLSPIASASPSPIKLKIVTVTKIAAPGNTASHQALALPLAILRRLPQVSPSAPMPIPRNDSVDSIKIAEATPNATVMSTGPMAFGSACRSRMRRFGKAMARAASI